MSEERHRSDTPSRRKPLRLWPGVVIVALQLLIWFVATVVVPGAALVGVIAGVLGGLGVTVWWAFFSRAHWFERWGAIVVMIVGLAATRPIVDVSIATAGQGAMFFVAAIPILSLAFVAWAVASRRLSDGLRRATMVATILLACGVWTLARSDGITGDGAAELAWRWAATAEERLMARDADEPTGLPWKPVVTETTAEWPGFRGPDRDGVVAGVRIETAWHSSPPVELWRRPVGPAISSFAVHGDLLYTQEQRGDDEVVASYRVSNGAPVWRHRDTARFWDSHAGPGPHSTPTISGGRVFTFGATGIVNALDARDGTVAWSRNAASDTDTKVPYWGFSSSPAVVDDVVIVAVAGVLVGYDRATGDLRWVGPSGGLGHSSPHPLTIGGVAQLLLLSQAGATSVAADDGKVLWEHPWPGFPIVQPALTANGDVLISVTGDIGGLGIRRLAVAHGQDGWTVDEHWTSTRLKPYFSDFVVHQGHAFGFDGSILACIDLEDGARKWKGGRYGHGQLILLPDQDVLLVLSEQGDLALVGATPGEFTELARFPALDGKSWNHPVLVGDVLLVRNRQEMAAFRLPLSDG